MGKMALAVLIFSEGFGVLLFSFSESIQTSNMYYFLIGQIMLEVFLITLIYTLLFWLGHIFDYSWVKKPNQKLICLRKSVCEFLAEFWSCLSDWLASLKFMYEILKSWWVIWYLNNDSTQTAPLPVQSFHWSKLLLIE